MTTTLWTRTDALGEFSVRPLDPDADAALLHPWVTHPKAAFWLMQDADVAEVARFYREVAGNPHHDAFVGMLDGVPAFLIERYDPTYVDLVGLYDPEEGDVGMHFLCAPTDTPVHGFTRAVITTVMAWLFDSPATRRVVVEPDARNKAVHALNAAVGFEVVRTLRKPEKEALLSVCTRDQFHNASGGTATTRGVSA
ncbi:GNAT family N-acetyltransferase [Streptomyces sp. UNOC14_S4]|uniref:GNAT family N-acetyltransferase n=1 Tax=Streptomyces sp. UNOC14_S4 TaxID=2872340 RepID=UPI001E2C0D01|nr:GNAT family N-acetyltransferase [Streptomyces sp. UNOC14_S4]MCC3770481.1 acetyltransferase [Streptomyces sp. UNOC14_S4]